MSTSLYTTIKDTTPPTTATVGIVGQCYIDSTNQKYYICTSADTTAGTYVWDLIIVGTKKYQHNLYISFSNYNISFSIITTRDTEYSNLSEILADLAPLGSKRIVANGGNNSNPIYMIRWVRRMDETNLQCELVDIVNGTRSTTTTNSGTIEDGVISLC